MARTEAQRTVKEQGEPPTGTESAWVVLVRHRPTAPWSRMTVGESGADGAVGAPYSWDWMRSSTRCETPVTWMLVTKSGPRALRARRSGQLRRRWERAARGGRAGGDRLAGKEVNVTVCCRQCAIHARRNWRPATS